MGLLQEFYSSSLDSEYLIVQPDGQIIRRNAASEDGLLDVQYPVFPGSFNPLTREHIRICDTVRDTLGGCLCEISTCPCSKDGSELTLEDLRCVVSQFEWKYPVIVSKLDTYATKRALFATGLVRFVTGSRSFRDAVERTSSLPDVEFLVVARGADDARSINVFAESREPPVRFTMLGPLR